MTATQIAGPVVNHPSFVVQRHPETHVQLISLMKYFLPLIVKIIANMNTIMDHQIRHQLIERINSLSTDDAAFWGKMNVYQMLKHCAVFEEMALGRKRYKQAFIGRLFGRFALKSFLKDTPLRHNTPTVPEFRITEKTGDMDTARQNWIALIEEYANFQPYDFIHPFFGRLTTAQIGILSYKHSDHHLRQFGR